MTIGDDTDQVPDSTFTVNGVAASAPEAGSLVSALRDQVGLTGAKPGCLEGACGACTVLLDGEAIRTCQRTAGSVAGQRITTIEGLSGTAGGWVADSIPENEIKPGIHPAGGAPVAAGGGGTTRLHPVQPAFAGEGASQGGDCTPGMGLTGTPLLAAHPRPAAPPI